MLSVAERGEALPECCQPTPCNYHGLLTEFSQKCVFTHSIGWKVLYGILFVLTAIPVLLTLFLVPPWWDKFLHDIDLKAELFQAVMVWIIFGIGPLKICINRRLWKSSDFNRFMPTEIDDDEKFKKMLTTTVRTEGVFRFNLIWFFAYFVLPTFSLWFAGIPNGQWCMFCVIIPESIRMKVTNACNFPFELAVQGTKYRAEFEALRLQRLKDGDCSNPEVWKDVGACSVKLDEDLKALWKVAAKAFAVRCLEGASIAACMSVMGCAVSNRWVQGGLFVFGTLIGLGQLWVLNALAETTSICHTMQKLASDAGMNSAMDSDTYIQYMKTVQYLYMNPTGVKLPGVGEVTYTLLRSRAMPLVTALPALLTIVRVHLNLVQD